MEMDPNPPSFNIGMNVQPMDLGADYAKGMTAGQAAGESIGKGISAVADVAVRNQNATDMLNAMQQNKMLTPDQYNSIANKSLGAKEQMLGMFANQWMADQANQRALSLAKGEAGIDVAKQHASLVDAWNLAKSGNVAAVGGAKNLPWTPTVAVTGDTPPAPPPPPPPPMTSKAGGPYLPGTQYVTQVDSQTGKKVLGHQLPSGQFIPDPGQ